MKNLWQSIWDKNVDTDSEQMQIQSERTHTQNIFKFFSPTSPPPKKETLTPIGKRKIKKKQVLLLFALPHWVPKKYLPH
jgi:hypothetical protein